MTDTSVLGTLFEASSVKYSRLLAYLACTTGAVIAVRVLAVYSTFSRDIMEASFCLRLTWNVDMYSTDVGSRVRLLDQRCMR